MKIVVNKADTLAHNVQESNVSLERIKELAIILFFAQPFLTWALGFVLGRYAGYAVLLFMYLPVFLVLLLGKGKKFPYDFFLLWITLLLFFLVTYVFHPDYADVYRKAYYGVWDYVLMPFNGLYAYLFLRLIDDPKRILKCLRISALMAYVYYAFTLYTAIRVGYWETNWDGTIIRISYSLEFGYDLLLYVLVFFYCALKYKKPIDWIMSAAGIFMIMGAGSRGPILDIIIFVALFVLVELDNKKNKSIYVISLIALMVGVFLLYAPILNFLSNIMERVGLQSRFIQMMLSGRVAEDNGRVQIWQHAIQMIKNNPFGYGAMGSRHEIINTIFVGHPHNIILEFMIDYGVFFGSFLLIIGIVSVIRCLRASIADEWKGLIIIFVGLSSQLLLSGTYWHRQGIWGLLAVIIGIRLTNQITNNRKRLKNES